MYFSGLIEKNMSPTLRGLTYSGVMVHMPMSRQSSSKGRASTSSTRALPASARYENKIYVKPTITRKTSSWAPWRSRHPIRLSELRTMQFDVRSWAFAAPGQLGFLKKPRTMK